MKVLYIKLITSPQRFRHGAIDCLLGREIPFLIACVDMPCDEPEEALDGVEWQQAGIVEVNVDGDVLVVGAVRIGRDAKFADLRLIVKNRIASAWRVYIDSAYDPADREALRAEETAQHRRGFIRSIIGKTSECPPMTMPEIRAARSLRRQVDRP
jgi:hypothetical protein